MKFQAIVIIGVLASVLTGEGKRFGEFELQQLLEHEPVEVKRDKRSLTTICVEIKPSTPYEEPYFMCKGTDMQKGEPSYASKPSFKPKPSESYGGSDYHGPAKSDHYQGEAKYGKPTSYDAELEYAGPSKPIYDKRPSYSDHGSHSAYSNYEDKQPSSYSHDDYAKPAPHKVTYDNPSKPYENPHAPKPQSYNYESPSYGSNESTDYSKPSYSQPSSYSDHSTHTSSKPSYSEHSSKPVYSEISHSKPSYGKSGTSYSTASKSGYSKPSTYSSKPTVYDSSEQSSYDSSKPAYGEPKPYPKQASASYSKPAYSDDAYSNPAAKPYSNSEKGYGHDHPTYSTHTSKPFVKGYGQLKPDYSSHPRSMPSDDIMQQMWDTQSQGPQADSFRYRAMGAAMDQDQQPHQYTPFDGPMKIDFSEAERNGPTLQSPYLYSPHAPPAYGQDTSYGPPPYASVSPSYAPLVPPYAPVAPSYAPVSSYYQPAPSSYSAPSHESTIPAYAYPTQVFKPSCQQSYLYSFQPAIISLPCLSSPASYGQSSYSQPLGAPASATLGEQHQLYPSNINPLQDHGTARSSVDSESDKAASDSAKPKKSQEDAKQPDSQSEPSQNPKPSKMPESPKSPNPTEEKPAEKKQEQVAAAKNIDEDRSLAIAGAKGNDGSDTKQAYDALIRMSKIAAQLKKDDPTPKVEKS